MNILTLKYLDRYQWQIASEKDPELSPIFRSSSETEIRDWADNFISSFDKVTLDFSELDRYIEDRNIKSKGDLE